MFLVGAEVAPGRYRSTSLEPYCAWARLSGFSGNLHDKIDGQSWIIGQPIDSATGQPLDSLAVEVAPGDAGFSSDGCGQWTPAP